MLKTNVVPKITFLYFFLCSARVLLTSTRLLFSLAISSFFEASISLFSKPYSPGLTLHGYLSKILARSCQDVGKILAKILPRYCQELQDFMVRSYQESYVPKKKIILKSYLGRKNLKGSQQKDTSMQIYIVRHDNFLLTRYKIWLTSAYYAVYLGRH